MAREPAREWTRGQAPSFPRVLTMPFFSLLLIEFERLVLFPDSPPGRPAHCYFPDGGNQSWGSG
jgi:hypothetical protein